MIVQRRDILLPGRPVDFAQRTIVHTAFGEQPFRRGDELVPCVCLDHEGTVLNNTN